MHRIQVTFWLLSLLKKYGHFLAFVLLTLGPVSVAWTQTVPQKYVAQKTIQALAIDGIDGEMAWQAAPWSSPFIDIEGAVEPKYASQMKMLWDTEYLYFFAKMEEPHVWGTLKQRDTVVFYNNDFEIFIDPDGDTHNYMEFEMNALNTVWDLFLTKPYRNSGRVLNGWDIAGLKTAVQVKGTLNNPTDSDMGWSVEIAMPWTALLEAANPKSIPVNHFWRINFSRVNWQFVHNGAHYSRKKGLDGKFLPEYNWVWSPQGVINMHEPEHWGYVFFSDKQQGNLADFEIPKPEHVKWHLYDHYSKLLHSGENFEQVRSQTLTTEKRIFDQPILLNVDQHVSGWSIWTVCPFSQQIMGIQQDGRFFQRPK